MNRASPDFNEMLFLAAQSLDEPLTTHDQRRLEEWLAGSELARAEFSALQSVDRLIRAWGRRRISLGNTDLGESVCRSLNARREGPDERIDRLLAQWADNQPLTDWDQYPDQVLARIRSGKPERVHRHWVVRLGVPLAAAAAVVVAWLAAIQTTLMPGSTGMRVAVVQMGPVDSAGQLPTDDVRRSVVFVRESVMTETKLEPESELTLSWVGSRRGTVQGVKAPPL